MKTHHVTSILICSVVLGGCAYVPLNEDQGAARRVSPDYRATGHTEYARAFIYGGQTVLDLSDGPALLWIKDEQGKTVDYERIGRYYRVNGQLENFTAWVNGRHVTFAIIPSTRVFSSSLKTTNQADTWLMKTIRLVMTQIQEIRTFVSKETDINKTLNARYLSGTSATMRVAFDTSSADFAPSPELATVLSEAAKTAEKITIRGRTDSSVAGTIDADLARNRALSARKFLLANGIKPEKIRVFSQGAGDFIAPNTTNEGKAINRRVEIQLVSSRFENLQF
ncbi:MAG: OmpA family protein [Nitrosospira sp.]